MHALRIVGRVIAALALVSLLAACGGGGGSASTGSNGSGGNAVSGSVTNIAGAPLDTIPLALKGTATQNTATDTSGNYGFSGLASGKYVVMPVNTLYKFRPASRAISLTGAAVTNQNFTAKQSTSPSYSLSGVVSGAVTQNVIVTLNGDNTGSTFTDAGGNYSFSGLDAGTYTVSAQSAGYSFNILNPITIASSNSTANNFVASTAPSGALNFKTVNPMPQATVGAAYSNTTVASISGGSAPYHFQSDTFANGAPPFGMIVNISGNLTGTPTDAGQYTFGVCATDLTGLTTNPCESTSITVVEAPTTSNFSLSYTSSVCVQTAPQNYLNDTLTYAVAVSGPVNSQVFDQGSNSPTSCGAWTYSPAYLTCTRTSTSQSAATSLTFSGQAQTGLNTIATYADSPGIANSSGTEHYSEQVSCP